MQSNLFEIEMEVRDYECDHQGIVNNAVYHNYFEHARHKFLMSQGINFNTLITKKIFLVMAKSETEYLQPLKPNDIFTVTVKNFNISKVKCVFEQEIIISERNKVATRCKITAVAVNVDGKLISLNSTGLTSLNLNVKCQNK